MGSTKIYNIKNWVKEKIFGKSDRRYSDIPLLSESLHLPASSQCFLNWGEDKIKEFVELETIDKKFRVLDIGCGSGRVAIPLTRYLSPEGSYEGLDINRDRIYWLNKNVSDKYPNFKFTYSDIYNGMYNKRGQIKASEYKLPFEDESFDFVFLLSVFTHMLPEDVNNYLREIYRVLKKGSKCYISYFLVNDKKLGLRDRGYQFRNFKIDKGDYWVRDYGVDENIIGYNQKYIENMYKKVGFQIIQIGDGSWIGEKKECLGDQDFIIAEKPKEDVKKKVRLNDHLPPSQYGEFPKIPENIEFRALRKDFHIIGDKAINIWKSEGLINEKSRILDIGCGNGRIAMPLTKYLGPEGSYEGLDIHKGRINWLKENVSEKYPQFKFRFVDAFNSVYNSKGVIKSSEYKFPFEDNSFDFVFLASVFTHMLPEDVENYMKEVHRVLKKTGKCCITYFLVNDIAIELINKGICGRDLHVDKGVYWVRGTGGEEAIVGYDENYIKNLYRKVGFFKDLDIRYGNWRTNKPGEGNLRTKKPGEGVGQDFIIAEK